MNATGLVDLKPQLGRKEVREILSLCVGFSTPEKIERICNQYVSDPRRKLLGYKRGGKFLGCIGLQMAGADEAVICHISVLPRYRRQGIGKGLIELARSVLSLRRLSAETDADAREFYRRCGFRVTSLGEKYPGTERFLCTLEE